ncbi:MAG TPA: glucosamine-6-phosphate deaminase [Bacteroidales bacterium]|nr:glucosamine-6-phosphate deaminase [Bacteroidales bacterium]
MKQIIYKDYPELSVKTAEMIADIIIKKPDALLCFPAGETSVGTFKHLIELNKSDKISFKHCKIVGLDEWANIGEMKSENCFSFLKKHLFDHIDYSEENLSFFDGESSDLRQECIKTDNFIRKHGPIDMILLGVGMNGHLALNEPGTPFDLYSHIVELDETTKKVGQKYFLGKVKLTSGISLGLKYIIEAKTVILQLNGSRKAEVAKKLIESEISPAFPASIIKSHLDSYFLLDKEGAGYL